MTADFIKSEILKTADTLNANRYQQFFQCFPGGYGFGDTFAGIRNPVLRKAARTFQHIPFSEWTRLFTDPIHEIRLLAIFILELKYKSKKTTDVEREQWVAFYLEHLHVVNNWDLVDASAPYILGPWAFKNDSGYLFLLANSEHLWSNRVAMLACYFYIRNRSFEVPLFIAEILLPHKHDLIHKAVGWMLREIGKRDRELELEFLKKHYKALPRTTLRYAIEKFDKPLQQKLLKGMFE